jgi:hypothetical protein
VCPVSFVKDEAVWKTCGRSVNILWTERHLKFFCRRVAFRTGRFRSVDEPSSVASLDRRSQARKIRVAPAVDSTIVNPDLRRFEHSIAGRPFLIEVAAVARDRWRACIVSMPGVPTALMPFYGRTPDEAARQLSEWLTRAHQRPAVSPAEALRAKADGPPTPV